MNTAPRHDSSLAAPRSGSLLLIHIVVSVGLWILIYAVARALLFS